LEDFVRPTLDFIAAHAEWAALVMFVTAFGESFAFVSLAFPGTSLLIAAGALMSAGTLPYGPVIAAAVIGATLGDTISYWLGRRFGDAIGRFWPFSRYPDLLPRGIAFFEQHGGKSVFIGRFFGPIRAVIPLAAGLMRMPRGAFWIANVASALVWAPMLLVAGDLVGEAGGQVIGKTNTIVAVFAAIVVLGIAGGVWAAVKAARSRP